MPTFPDFLKIGIKPFSCEPEGENSLLFLSVTKVKKFFMPMNSDMVESEVASGLSICSTEVRGRTMPTSVALSNPDSSRTCGNPCLSQNSSQIVYIPLARSAGSSSEALVSGTSGLVTVRSYSEVPVDQNTWKQLTM